ncbi:hypothetical protein [Pseudophaeobacter sp.]|uniref:hypothetical protein n=1 Tax=Pseudophaeobacter sp. TaxID=1971739 RepID=UPI0040585A5D
MYDRNQLVHAVIWPVAGVGAATLLDGEGVLQSQIEIREPVLGSQLSKMIPQDFFLDVHDCTVVSMSGQLVVATKSEFDTVVVTERAALDYEERMQRLERRDARRDAMQAKLAAENLKLREQIQRDAEKPPEVIDEAGPKGDEAPAGTDEGGPYR